MANALSERFALDEMEPRWVSQGYKLIRNPSDDQIPGFLGSFTPDAIAIGKQPGLIIEVVNPKARHARTKVSEVRRLIANNPDWRLEVVYSPTDATEIGEVPKSEIQQTLDEAALLIEAEPRAALLLAWAGLEAVGRMLNPKLANYSMSSGTLINLLVSQGNLNIDDQQELRDLASIRNKIAHGQLSLQPDPRDVKRLLDLTRSML